MAVLHILVVTGASGAGKTVTVQGLAERALPGVQCFHFDSLGVPSPGTMLTQYGGGDEWQAAATLAWLRRLDALGDDIRVAVLDAQTRPTVVFGAAAQLQAKVQVALFDCSPEVRAARLHGPRRQPELATPQMDAWAAYLRGQADAFRLPVINTSSLTLDEAIDQLEVIVQSLGNVLPPDA